MINFDRDFAGNFRLLLSILTVVVWGFYFILLALDLRRERRLVFSLREGALLAICILILSVQHLLSAMTVVIRENAYQDMLLTTGTSVRLVSLGIGVILIKFREELK